MSNPFPGPSTDEVLPFVIEAIGTFGYFGMQAAGFLADLTARYTNDPRVITRVLPNDLVGLTAKGRLAPLKALEVNRAASAPPVVGRSGLAAHRADKGFPAIHEYPLLPFLPAAMGRQRHHHEG